MQSKEAAKALMFLLVRKSKDQIHRFHASKQFAARFLYLAALCGTGTWCGTVCRVLDAQTAHYTGYAAVDISGTTLRRPFGVTLNTLGTQSITATSGGVTGSQTGIAVNDAIWVLNAVGTLNRLNGGGSAVTTGIGSSGTAASYGGAAFDSTGNAWSVSTSANSLYFASSLGAAATSYTGGGLSAPDSVAVDGAGYVWVANQSGNTVSEFTNAGVAQSSSSGYGSSYVSGEALNAPSAIAIDQTGGVWVASKSGNTVTHIFGAATPVVTPLSTGTVNGTLGTKP